MAVPILFFCFFQESEVLLKFFHDFSFFEVKIHILSESIFLKDFPSIIFKIRCWSLSDWRIWYLPFSTLLYFCTFHKAFSTLTLLSDRALYTFEPFLQTPFLSLCFCIWGWGQKMEWQVSQQYVLAGRRLSSMVIEREACIASAFFIFSLLFLWFFLHCLLLFIVLALAHLTLPLLPPFLFSSGISPCLFLATLDILLGQLLFCPCRLETFQLLSYMSYFAS